LQLDILKAGTESEIDAPSQPSSNCMPARSLSPVIPSSAAGASSSWRWHHAMAFRDL